MDQKVPGLSPGVVTRYSATYIGFVGGFFLSYQTNRQTGGSFSRLIPAWFQGQLLDCFIPDQKITVPFLEHATKCTPLRMKNYLDSFFIG